MSAVQGGRGSRQEYRVEPRWQLKSHYGNIVQVITYMDMGPSLRGLNKDGLFRYFLLGRNVILVGGSVVESGGLN